MVAPEEFMGSHSVKDGREKGGQAKSKVGKRYVQYGKGQGYVTSEHYNDYNHNKHH